MPEANPTTEIWKPIRDYESLYDVSDFGNVRRVAPFCKLSVSDVEEMRQMRNQGTIFRVIGERFGVTKEAVIKALSYKYKRTPLRVPYRILKHCFTQGYACVMLCKNGIAKSHRVHQLVAEAFLGPCPVGKEINHKNGQRADPRLQNLEYVTPSENCLHAYHVLGIPGNAQKGSANGSSILIESQVLRIRELYALGTSPTVLAGRFCTHRDNIYRIVHRKSWRHI